jgi:hypothetical protein
MIDAGTCNWSGGEGDRRRLKNEEENKMRVAGDASDGCRAQLRRVMIFGAMGPFDEHPLLQCTTIQHTP